MVLLTYQLPAEISRVAEEGEFDEFDLNAFFEAEGKGEDAIFKHHDEVQKWLDPLHCKTITLTCGKLTWSALIAGAIM